MNSSPPIPTITLPTPKPEQPLAKPGMTSLDNRGDAEGFAVRVLAGYRVRRPKRRPKKSRGHGLILISDPGAYTPKKKPPNLERPFAVPNYREIPASVMAVLRKRPEMHHYDMEG